ncbi:hypothetical protein B5K06_25250 [Rhizobium grahamii]|uniref:DUF1127 domain-containing protein n=1 Tax=Rhizobium grahamii TaxID=1120045 RepID=A0A370KIN3_9HYPH|nr:hypothetical protein B5K06_25250 [Rhizobium grahamii]
MSAFSAITPHLEPETNLARHLRTALRHWVRFTRFLDRHAAIARLRELDDDRLRDMGLARSEVEAAASGLMDPKRVN